MSRDSERPVLMGLPGETREQAFARQARGSELDLYVARNELARLVDEDRIPSDVVRELIESYGDTIASGEPKLYERTVTFRWPARNAEHADDVWDDDGPETSGVITTFDASEIREVEL